MNTPSPSLRSGSVHARRFFSAGFAALILAAAGCTTPTEPAGGMETAKYTLENTDKFLLLDRASLNAITCTGLHSRPDAEGRIIVVANLKNRGARPIKIEASCLFRDALGAPTGEETPWQTLTIPANTTETVRFTAASVAGKEYTVRVRQGR